VYQLKYPVPKRKGKVSIEPDWKDTEHNLKKRHLTTICSAAHLIPIFRKPHSATTKQGRQDDDCFCITEIYLHRQDHHIHKAYMLGISENQKKRKKSKDLLLQ
jgi:hypothetical protein